MKDFENEFERMLAEIKDIVALSNKRSVLILIQHTKAEETYPCVPMVRESISNVLGFVSLGDEEYLTFIIEKAKGIIDVVMIDVDPKRENSERIRQTASRLAMGLGMSVSFYSDYDSWVSSALSFVFQVEKRDGKDVYEVKHLMVGRNMLATRMVLEMIGRGLDVFLLKAEYSSLSFPISCGEMVLDSNKIHLVDLGPEDSFDTLIGCELQSKCNYLEELSVMHFSYVHDVGIRNFTLEFIEKQRQQGAEVYRSDDRAGISGAVISLMETEELIRTSLGRTRVGDISIVSGGYVGEEGDVVVDNYNDPRIVFGIAKGDGTFKSELDFEDENKIKRIEKLI